MSTAITNVDRGCGRRAQGACYLEVGVGPGGLPIEAFIIDPVQAIPPELQRHLGLAGPHGTMALGVHLVPRPGMPGVYDVWDVVGEANYPNVADFLEEARRYGVSRRIASTTDFSKIGPYSRLVILHAKAFVGNWHSTYAPDWRRVCPIVTAVRKGAPNVQVPEGHDRPASAREDLCAGIWWEDVTGGRADPQPSDTARAIQRDMPPGKTQWSYAGRKRPDNTVPVYALGTVASFPMSRIAVVKAPDGSHVPNLTRAQRANIRVEEATE